MEEFSGSLFGEHPKKSPFSYEDDKKTIKCPICKVSHYTKIEKEIDFYNGHYLCLNCMTVFSKDKKVIERG